MQTNIKIKTKLFTHSKDIKGNEEILEQCPFYDFSTGCKFKNTGSACCYHEEQGKIAENCPLRLGSVTVIYYLED